MLHLYYICFLGLIYPERYDPDPTGVGLYERHCEEIGVQPITYFIKHMQDTILKMKFHGLGPQGMRAIAGNIEVINESLVCVCIVNIKITMK